MTTEQLKIELSKTPGVSYQSMATTISMGPWIKEYGVTKFLNEICRAVELAADERQRKVQMDIGANGITSNVEQLAVVTVSIMAKFDVEDSYPTATPKNT